MLLPHLSLQENENKIPFHFPDSPLARVDLGQFMWAHDAHVGTAARGCPAAQTYRAAVLDKPPLLISYISVYTETTVFKE